MPENLDFYDLLPLLKKNGIPLNLLLGNGFSIGYSEKFKYEKILECSNLQNAKQLFKMFNTDDYEEVINRLNNHIELQNYYYPQFKIFTRKITHDINEIKRDLCQCITSIHPNNLYEKNCTNTINFIGNFNNIFTLNYDMLLYWLILEYNKTVNKNFWDGFCKNQTTNDCEWDASYSRTNIFYLHGAIHLFCNNSGTYKIKPEVQTPLLSIIGKLQNDNIMPLIVTEGDSYSKYNTIMQQQYLTSCYQKLSDINGYLVLYGLSLKQNDDHIFYAINNNYKIEKIFISVYQEDENVIKNAFSAFPYKEIIFYNAESVNLWK